MQLCFDATRFGTGLDGAIDLAASKGINAIEYSFAPFTVSTKKASALSSKESRFLEQIKTMSLEKNIAIVCLNLDYVVDFKSKNTDKNFAKMLVKMADVAKTIGCPKLSMHIEPNNIWQPASQAQADNNSWLSSAEKEIANWQNELGEKEVELVLRLSTPKDFRSKSLKYWTMMEPQDWRDLLAACPGLSLSFSPADCIWLGIDYLKILPGIISGITHIEAHDIEINRQLLADSGLYGPLWWRYRIPGKGQVDWVQLIEALKLYGFAGNFSVHLDDEFVEDDAQSLSDALDGAIKFFTPLISQ